MTENNSSYPTKNPYGLTDKQMDEIKKGNILGGRVVDGKFYADWNYDVDISEALEYLSSPTTKIGEEKHE